jgi:hypothetical protein
MMQHPVRKDNPGLDWREHDDLELLLFTICWRTRRSVISIIRELATNSEMGVLPTSVSVSNGRGDWKAGRSWYDIQLDSDISLAWDAR